MCSITTRESPYYWARQKFPSTQLSQKARIILYASILLAADSSPPPPIPQPMIETNKNFKLIVILIKR